MKNVLMILFFLSVSVSMAWGQQETHQQTKITGALPGEPRPTIIFLHGAGGNGGHLQRQIKIDQDLARLGAVAIYPSGDRGVWRVGKFQSRRNDVRYLDHMIDYFVAQKIVDPKRLYLAGISNGGLMVQRMVCSSKYQFSGVAVIGATHPNIDDCATPKPAPMIFFWGSADTFFPVDGQPANDWAKKMNFTTRGDTLAFWRAAYHCPRDVLPVVSPDGLVELRDYPECTTPLAVYDLIGVGHTWPGIQSSPRLRDQPDRHPGTFRVNDVLLNTWNLR